MLDVLTIGGATRDIFFRIDEIKKVKDKKTELLTVPYGAKLVSSDTYYSYGGGAINVAVSLSRLGLRSGSCCNIGAEGTGSLVVKSLVQEKVSPRYVSRDTSSHTGLSVFVLGEDCEHTGFLERGANNNFRLPEFGIRKPAEWFYLSSLTGQAAAELPKIFRYARKKGIKIAFNPGSVQLKLGHSALKEYLAQVELLIVNMDEAKQLVPRVTEPKALLKKLSGYGPKIVVITDSEKGSWAIESGEIFYQKSIHHGILDTTGAGDSFGSTVLFGLIKGFAMPYVLKIAAINAASVISKMGSREGLLKYREIKGSKWL